MTLEKKGPGFDEYLAGGFLANAPLLFFTYAVKALLPEEVPFPELEVASILAVSLGGMAAGYLVVRRADRDHMRTGLKTGLSAFLVNLAFSSIILTGTPLQYTLLVLTLFCLTAMLGALLRRVTAKKAESESHKEIAP